MTSVDPEPLLAQTVWLRSLARKLARDPSVADDVVQDTWLAALERPPRELHHAGKLRRWLARVAQNAARMRLRAELRRRVRERLAANPLVSPGADDTAAEVAAQRQLLDAVAALPASLRDVVVRRYLRGQPPREIATHLGCTSGAVRSRLTRALAILRARLTAEPDDRPPTDLRRAWLPALILMNTSTKVTLAAAAACGALALTLWSVGNPDGPASPSAPPPAPPPAVAGATPGEVDPSAGPVAPSGDAPAAERAERRVAASPPKPAGDGGRRLVATGRCVDEHGEPIADAVLTAVWVVGAPQARAGADGRVELAVDWPAKLTQGNPSWLMLEATAAGRVVVSRQEAVARSSKDLTIALGDLVLGPGGAVAGVVVDERGAPLAGARVWPVQPTTPTGGVAEERRLVFGDGLRGLGGGLRMYATTDDDGRYRLAGVPAGALSVAARRPGVLCSYTAPFEVAAGGETRAPTLALGDLPAENCIRGVVLDAAERPLVARVSAYENRGPRNINAQSMAVSRAEDGVFRLPVQSGQSYTLTVELRGRARRLMVRHDVAAGADDVVLRFRAPQPLELVLLDPDGERVEPTGVWATNENGTGENLDELRDEHGERVPLVPGYPFRLTIQAEGYLPAKAGPFDPDRVPTPIEVRLERLPQLVGRVFADGAPLAGAMVHAHLVDGRARMLRFARDVYTRLGKPSSAAVRTDEQGRFTLPMIRDGRYVLHAQAAGFARAESAPVSFARDAAASTVELRMVRPASIEGRVLVGPGDGVEGRVVAATRGDGHVEVAVTGADGAYRFAGLAPGGWQVRVCRTDEQRWLRAARTWPERDVEQLPVDVELFAGHAARYDVDLRARTNALLTGRVTMGGAACGGFVVTVLGDAGQVRATTDDDGRFEVAGGAGTARVYVFGRLPSGGELEVARTLALTAGANTLELDLPVGGVELQGLRPSAAPPSAGRPEGYALEWREAGDGARCIYRFDPDEAGRHRAPALPAGAARLRRRDDDRTLVGAWPVLQPVEVGEGELRTVTVK